MGLKIEPRPVTTTRFFIEINGKEFDVEILADFLYCVAGRIDTEDFEEDLEDVLIDMKIIIDDGFKYHKGLNFKKFYNELINECKKIKALGFDIQFHTPPEIVEY